MPKVDEVRPGAVCEEARLEVERSLILRQLTRKVGELPEAVRSQSTTLSLTQLEALAEALLSFATLVQRWLICERDWAIDSKARISLVLYSTTLSG